MKLCSSQESNAYPFLLRIQILSSKKNMTSDKMIRFNGDLSFDMIMMVILNFVVLTKNITGCLRGIHVLGKIWFSF